jgi:hypothetical protein
MRNAIPPQPQSALRPNADAHRAVAANFKYPLPFSSLAILAGAAAMLLAGAMVHAQTPANQTPAPAVAAPPRPTHTHKHSPAHLAAPPAPEPVAPVTPPAPETPKWPAFDKAAEASVVWDSHGLLINAANSSLEQILHDVSTATGAKVEGLSTDQRVFGQYGPGQARDVLSELLLGSGYNVIMIGDQGQGTPRQILLSVRQAGSPQPAAKPAANNDEDDVEEPPANQEQVSPRPGFPPGGPPRTPQQFQQELRERPQQQPGPPGQPQQPN